MRKTVEIRKDGTAEIVEHANLSFNGKSFDNENESISKQKEEHKCIYDQIIIRKCVDPSEFIPSIRVYTDCSCEESAEKPLVTFHENELLSCDNNFKGWFQSVVGYFVQNDFKIKDLR